MQIALVDDSLGERAIPDGRGGVVIVTPGVPFEIDDAIAGQPPGPWEPCEREERTADGHDLGDTAFEQTETGWRRRHLGRGLLAQEDTFRPVEDDEVPA